MFDASVPGDAKQREICVLPGPWLPGHCLEHIYRTNGIELRASRLRALTKSRTCLGPSMTLPAALARSRRLLVAPNWVRNAGDGGQVGRLTKQTGASKLSAGTASQRASS